MTLELSRRHLLEASGAIAASALLPTLPVSSPSPAFDLEALFGTTCMDAVRNGLRDGCYLFHDGARLPNLLTEQGRFNLSEPIRNGLMQIFSDGKDVLSTLPERSHAQELRDWIIVYLFRKYGVPWFTKYDEYEFVRQPFDRPVLGVYGNLRQAPRQNAMLLTQEGLSWQYVRSDPFGSSLFQLARLA